MKTSIIITGSGVKSKSTLLNAIPCYQSQVKELNFNNYKIDFKSKKEAVKALTEAYKKLKADPETKDQLWYSRNSSLSFDAGTATIEEL